MRIPEPERETIVRARITACIVLLGLIAGCSPDAATPAPIADRGTAMVADSARSIEAELASFRQGLRRPPRLEGGARSREALAKAFVRALAQRDTVALRELHLTRAEFAHFYYPYTIYTHPPYQQAPGLVWLLTTQNSQKGITRALRRFGGRRLEYRDHACADREPQDLNTLHRGCVLRLAGDPQSRSLFGTILERDGRFKFVSYANGL
jgi:hypothetical protein